MSEREAEALAGVDLVGSEFLRTRPRIVGVGLPLFFAAVLASGADVRQVVALGAFSTVVLGAFALEAAYARGRRLTTRWLHRSLAATALAIALGAWLSGGVTSPIVPMLFAPTALQLVAFGRARQAWVGAGLGVGLAVALAIVPSPFAELPVHVRRAGTAMAVAVSLTLVAAGATKLVAAYREALVEIAAQRAREVAASRARARSLETIGAQLAHEIKNPLAAARGLAQLLAKRPAEPKDAERFAVLLGELSRIDGLTADYARFARPLDLGTKEPIDLAALATRVALLLGPKAGERGVELACHVSPAPCHGDPARLEDALLSLVDNAIDASPRGATVELRAEAAGGRAQARIVDRGPDLAPDALARIGVPFHTTKDGGHGLGVAIARAVAAHHGGTLEHRRDDGATTATLDLPGAP